MKAARIILAIVVVFLAGYSVVAKEFGVMPYALLFTGLMNLVFGISEFQEKRKENAMTLFLTAGFVLFVSIYILLM
ncbi:YczI family protein [Lentibacillus juripiscarius]|uniref:YczI family protein n=1 Tax=Lentibacillus juripiscarius TaxID=257446 RepID=A0ABW5V398_9BACI